MKLEIRQLLTHPVHLLAFGLGAGLSPRAPGTAGTLLGALLYFPLASLGEFYFGLIIVGSFLAGIWICGRAAHDMGVADFGGIVWDEFVGIWITLYVVPMDWRWVIGGFLLFRLLDILKPWPIRLADQHVHGGFGIMLDDALAGIMAALCLLALQILGL